MLFVIVYNVEDIATYNQENLVCPKVFDNAVILAITYLENLFINELI